MRTNLPRLAIVAVFAAALPLSAQISITSQTTTMVNGNATPVLNGPLGNFVGNVGQNTGTPPANNGTVGQLPASEFATTPLITPTYLAQAGMQPPTVPPEFTSNVFASPPVVNYPTSVAATPDGIVFVAVDGNGAQSAWDHLGRIIRLRDTNKDGVADEAKAFVPDIDTPRGLVWNHDHLIVMAPPNVTVYYDRNNDGVVDESKVLIRNIGRTIADARVDHGQNTLEAGIDGWIYLALGDQGINGATGTDGRVVTMRGGGVIRFREDGSGLEVWAQGTRNIYGVAVGPLLDMFGRDNTNDGGGWDVRFHSFTGMTDHGYPSLFTNFPEEIVTRVADFGGGSGTGGMWLDEPGIPEHWNNAPYTADYGRGAIFLQRPTPKGATFEVTNEPFIQQTNIMDEDVDANSVIYVAKWSGGFSWAGRMNGMVYRVAPKDYVSPPLPNYDTITAAQLIQELQSPSNRRRLEASRAIIRRKTELGQGIITALEQLEADRSKVLSHRVAALFTDKQIRGSASNANIVKLISDPTIAALALRALGNDLAQAKTIPVEVVTGALKSNDPRTRKEALITLARADSQASIPLMAPVMTDADEVVALTAVQAIRSLRGTQQMLTVLDAPATSPALRKKALLVLQSFHNATVTNALETRLARETDVTKRGDLVAALARLVNTETAWNGTWWATRPQNVGPYYAPTSWAETARITSTLNSVLDKAGPEEVLAMGRQYVKQGVSAGAAVNKFLAFADTEPKLVPQITAYFATADDIPANAVPVLSKTALDATQPGNVRAEAVTALTKTSDRATWSSAILPSMPLFAAGGGAAGGRGAGGGRGGAAAPAAPAIPGANVVQTLLVSEMDTANVARLQAVTDKRTALASAPYAANLDRAALTAQVQALAQDELTLALARADSFAKIQSSVAKFNPAQATALAAQQAVATPPAAAAAGGRGGGGGGRGGGAPAATPTQIAQNAILNSPKLDDVYPVLIEEAAKMNGDSSQLADAALLTLAGRKFGTTPPRDAAAQALDAGWRDPKRKLQIILAAVTAKDTSRATQILAAVNDSDAAVSRGARYAVQQLNIDAATLAAAASGAKIGTMQTAAVLDAVVPAKGTIARGQQLTRELGCVACHTFAAGEAPKGPPLDKISAILQRRELAEAILEPNKTIAQGFATTNITLRAGGSVSGFIVSESGSSVTVRDITTKQTVIQVPDIANRRTLTTSLMPPGLTAELTIQEFASLLDYIESLGK